MRTVIVIEDDVILSDYVTMTLEEAGYCVAATKNGDRVLELTDETGAGIVITDIFMPVCDGIEVLRRLREARPEVKTIAISGGAPGVNLDPLRMANLLGADITLSKPFRPAQLVEAVKTLYEQFEDERRAGAA